MWNQPQNIVLSGGSTMFQHFSQRLKRDLRLIVDQRLDANAAASGNVRVSPESSVVAAAE